MRPVRKFHYGWAILVAAFLATMSFGSSRFLYGFVLPVMEADLGLPHSAMGNIASAYFLTYGAMAFIWGIVADRIGARKCMLMGLVILATGLSGMGFMQSLWIGLVSNLFSGAGAAGLYVPVASLLSAWFDGRRRGRAFGIMLMGSGTLISTAGLVTPIVLADHSWRWVWWAGALMVLAIAVICWFLLVNTPAQKGLSPVGASPLSLQVAGLAEGVSRSRVTIGQMLRRGTVWNFAGVWFCYGAGYAAFITFAVAYLHEIGWGIEQAAGSFAVFGAMSIPGPLVWGLLADRVTKKYLIMTALLVQGTGAMLIWGGDAVGGYVGAGMIGFGNIGMPVLLGSSMADYYEREVISTTLGFIILFLGLASVLSPTAAGAVADAAGTLRPAIMTSLGGYSFAFVLLLLLKKPRKRD
ncbi:MAG: MFS transporter [Chloroflexi bacterium]|nr:MFS transporter [Chloroflexota bacterium]